MPDERKVTISEGLVIAAIPVFAYFYAFIFELGYASCHNIPAELITVNLTNFFVFTVSIFTGLWFVILLINSFVTILINFNIPGIIKISIIRIGFVVVVSYTGTLFFSTNPYHWIIWFSVVLLFAFGDFIFPMLVYKGEKSYSDKLIAAFTRDREDKSGLDLVMDAIGKRNSLVVLLLFAGLFFTYGYGKYKARHQKSFYTIPINMQYEEYVVLKIYGNDAICKKYNNKFQLLNNELYIIKIKDNQKTELAPKNLGPLNLK